MPGKKTQSSGKTAAADPGDVAVVSRRPSLEADNLATMMRSQLDTVASSAADLQLCGRMIQNLAGTIEREIALLAASGVAIPAVQSGPERPATWPTMSEADHHQASTRFLLQSIEALSEIWDTYATALSETQTAARLRRGQALEHDLEAALAIVRERRDEALILRRNLAQAERQAASTSGEIERLERAVQHLRLQLTDAHAFNHMLASSTSWKLARGLMLPARYLPPSLRRVGRAVIRRLVALLRRLKPARPIPTSRPAPAHPGFSRIARSGLAASVAGGFEVIIALPGGEVPSTDMLDAWRAVVGSQGKIVVCAPAPPRPNPEIAFVPTPGGQDVVSHIDVLIRSAVSTTAVVVTGSNLIDAKGLETFATIFADRSRTIAACGVSTNNAGVILAAGFSRRPDGRLQPAGAGEAADDFAWSSVRPVDVLASPIVAFDVDAYLHVGGLRSHPDGYAAALAVFSQQATERALEVVSNPFARIIGPVDTPATPTLVQADGAQPHRARRRILVADAAAPTPDRDSGSLDLVWYIRIFQDLGYDVTFLPTLQREVDPAVEALRRMGVTVPLARDFGEPWQFIRDHGAAFDFAMLCRVTVACHLIDPIRTFAPETTVIFDTVDLHFLREERAAALTQSDELKDQASRTRIEELRVMDLAHVTMVRSKVEATLLAEIAPSVRTRIVPIVRPVDGRLSPVEDRRDMMFVGGFLHQPNLDAFEFLHAEIWPRIRAQLPEARLHIIGSSAPASVTSRHDPENGFIIDGYVADLDEYYRSIRVNLAPLRYGAGLKGKLVASLAKGVPSVATDLAAEGMDLEDMTNVLLASDAQAFADAAVRLYTDDWLWNRLSNEGVACAAARFSVEAVHANLESLLGELEKR